MSFVLHNIGSLLTLSGAVVKAGRNITPEDLGVLKNASLVVSGEKAKAKIVWVGESQNLPSRFKKFLRVNAHGAMVIPGFVDSHTHLVFAGDRSLEFGMRMAGKTYQDIAKAGGGIINSVKATREISPRDLYKLCEKRAFNFIKQGVTTFEIKTGYGLSFESEKKSLAIISQLKRKVPATILSTFLAAHAVPPEFKGRQAEYIEETKSWFSRLKNQTDFVDIFLDAGYFNKGDASQLFDKAKQLGIPTKIHADELELTGGTETAVEYKSLSADHLLKIKDEQIKLLAEGETTATLLPTTAFFLKTDYAPARKLLDRGARVALATDFNPGTSPTQDISLVGVLAALHMNMRVDEIIVALTLNGAFALGLEKRKGALVAGYDADFSLFEGSDPGFLFYSFGKGAAVPKKVFSRGVWS